MDSKHFVLFGGTFDPFTLGHLHIAEQALSFADDLLIAVFENGAKRPLLSADDRVALIRKAVAAFPNIRVSRGEGLVAEFCRRASVRVAVRGVRGAAHFEEECAMAEINRRLFPELVTVMIPTSSEFAHISSSAVREIARCGGNLRGWVPEVILSDVTRAYGTESR